VRLRRAGLHGIRLSSTSAADFISESMKADWFASHDALLTFWKSGKDALECFPPADVRPWLFPCAGSPDTLPWAARQFDR